MIKIPYGQSYFAGLVRGGFHFVDKTAYLETMEAANSRFLFFLRPRRFGKSLWVSMLHHYYGLEHKKSFSELFGKYHIGQHPTPLANQYFVLMFEFAGIDTRTEESTYSGFLHKVKNRISSFFDAYRDTFPVAGQEEVLMLTAPEMMLNAFFTLVIKTAPEHKIYLLIDEYDHFANELLAFRFKDFIKTVGHNGFVRKFYEIIKFATQQGIVERLFVTGVSSLTLDSMTSGFNIGVNITLNARFEGLMGFTKKETEEVLLGIEIPEAELPAIFEDLKKWYNGYSFNPDGKERFYNSDIVLYFADHYSQRGGYPEEMLDVNIASDYGKVRQLFRIGGQEAERLEILDELLTEGEVAAKVTSLFNFEKGITKDDFISLLFYQGMVTVSGRQDFRWLFAMPNAVIKSLYYDYFAQIINERTGFEKAFRDIKDNIFAFLWRNEPEPLLELVGFTLKKLSNRDDMRFDEKHLKAIFASFLNLSQAFFIRSEPEVERQYPDLLLTRRLPFESPFQFLIELKYLHKNEAAKFDSVCKEARQQVQGYLATEEIAALEDLKSWFFVVVGTEIKLAEEQHRQK